MPLAATKSPSNALLSDRAHEPTAWSCSQSPYACFEKRGGEWPAPFLHWLLEYGIIAHRGSSFHSADCACSAFLPCRESSMQPQSRSRRQRALHAIAVRCESQHIASTLIRTRGVVWFCARTIAGDAARTIRSAIQNERRSCPRVCTGGGGGQARGVGPPLNTAST